MTLKPEHIVEALNKKTFDEIDPDEVLKHYGYKPEEVRCNGVGIGVWRKEEAFQKLGDIGAFMRFVDHKAKARIEFNYDPDFPPQRRKISFPEECICILEENKEKIQSPLAMSRLRKTRNS